MYLLPRLHFPVDGGRSLWQNEPWCFLLESAPWLKSAQPLEQICCALGTAYGNSIPTDDLGVLFDQLSVICGREDSVPTCTSSSCLFSSTAKDGQLVDAELTQPPLRGDPPFGCRSADSVSVASDLYRCMVETGHFDVSDWRMIETGHFDTPDCHGSARRTTKYRSVGVQMVLFQ